MYRPSHGPYKHSAPIGARVGPFVPAYGCALAESSPKISLRAIFPFCVIIGTEFRPDPFDNPVFSANLLEKTETFWRGGSLTHRVHNETAGGT